MYPCDICTKELNDNERHDIRAGEFKQIVQNGFNPFTEDIRFPTGLHLSAMGAFFGQSVNEQYQGWKSRVLADETDWGLCDRCYDLAIRHLPARTRPQWGRILVWVGLLALLVILALGLRRSQQGPVAVGQRVPEFTLTTFAGDQIKLSDLKGKVVVLNFWASWCGPCEEEAADLEAAWRYYQPRGDVVFLGVDYVDTEPEARLYLEKFDITYPNGPDLGTRISQAFRIKGVPETYIIDQERVLRNVQISPFLSLDDIKSMIEPLLNP